MNKIIILALFIFFTQNSFSVETKTKLTFASDEYCPYNCIAESKQEGYVVDIVKRIFDTKDFLPVYLNTPWTRAIRESRKGKISGILASPKTDAPDFIYPKEPVGYARFCIYVRKTNNFKYTGFESLKKINVGVINSYSYPSSIQKNIDRHDPIFIMHYGANANERMINKVIHNHMISLIDNQAVTLQNIKKLGDKNQLRNAGCIDDEIFYLYVGFSPATKLSAASHELAIKFDEEFNKLKQNGELTKILKPYHLNVNDIIWKGTKQLP